MAGIVYICLLADIKLTFGAGELEGYITQIGSQHQHRKQK